MRVKPSVVLCFALSILAGSVSAEDLTISSEGRPGVGGRPGNHGGSASFTTGRGGDATDGGDATHGQSAGNQKIRLQFIGPQEYRATGTAGNQAIDETRSIRSHIYLRARGTDGGDGGNGGNGGKGGKGYRGDNARPGQNGTDGGPGGPGGNAGAGGNGGDAGSGGEILLIAPLEDIALFSLLAEASYNEGRPGSAGLAGNAGWGGDGGDGGNSLRWYTTETRMVQRSRQVPYTATRTVTKYRSHTVIRSRPTRSIERQPDGSTRLSTGSETYTDTVSEPYSDTETYTAYRTEYYMEPEQYQQPHDQLGGSDGARGPFGLGSSNGRGGAPGRRGSFAFQIEDKGTLKTYSRLFNLRLNPYTIRDENGDGRFEPGERGFVEAIVVQNPSEMPTPPKGHSFIRISLPSDQWMESDGKNLVIDDSIAGGASHPFEQGMAFRIRDIDGPSRKVPWQGGFTISPQAVLDPLASRFSEFNRPVDASVAFPVVFRLDAPPALAQGERGRVRLHITNISGATVGGDGTTQRLLSMFLKENAKYARAMEFATAEGTPASLQEGVAVAIENLKPGQTRTLEGSLFVPLDYPPQSSYSFDTSMRLGRLDRPAEARDIQVIDHKLTVASKYHTDPNADIALVINSNTTPAELAAWKELLEDHLGYRMVTWDAAYYANFDLDREFIQDPRWHLLRDFKQKTVLVLDNEFRSYSGQLRRATRLLTREAFLRAVGEYEVNFVVLSPEGDASPSFDPLDCFARVTAGQGSRNYSSVEGLLRSIDILHRDALSSRDRAPQMGDFHRVKFVEHRLFDADENYLKSKAVLLDKHLQQLWPERRYLVVYDLKNTTVQAGGWTSRPKIYVGDITVQRLPDEGDEVALVAGVSDADLHSPEYILGEDNLHHLFAGMHVQQKLALLRRLLTKANHGSDPFTRMAGKALVDGLIRDVLIDYGTALRGPTARGSRSPRVIAQMRNWRADEAIVPGSLAEELLRRLYTRAMIAGYYAYGNIKQASRSASEDLEVFGVQLFASTVEWENFRAQVKSDTDALFKDSAVSGWSYNQTNYDRMENTLLSDLASVRYRVLGLQEGQSRVLSADDLQKIARESQAWRDGVGQAFETDQRARAELRIPAKLDLETPDPK